MRKDEITVIGFCERASTSVKMGGIGSATSVFVPHDQTETMSMSDRIAVLNGGCVEQYAAPETSWHDPASEFVACFVGKPNWLSETEMFRPETAAQTPAKGALHFELPVQSVQYPGSPAMR